MTSLDEDLRKLGINGSVKAASQEYSDSEDVTARFIEHSAVLHVGQLMHDDKFNLFDTVPALEIMDPKMDAGCLEADETLEDDYDVARKLLPEEVIWIMDQLLCYQVAWHQGYALSQNLFSSLYIDHILSWPRTAGTCPSFFCGPTAGEPDEQTEMLLTAFCISIVKNIDISIEVVASQHYYEEEDFNTQLFGKDLLTDFPDDRYFWLVDHSYRWIQTQMQEGNLDRSTADALCSRLLLNCRLLDTLYPVPDSCTALKAYPYRSVEDLVETIKKTHHIGDPVSGAFSSKLQRRLASNTPPRPLNVVKFEDACKTILELREDLVDASTIEYARHDMDMPQIEAFLWSFAGREPLPLPRAAVQLHLFSPGKRAALQPGGMERILWNDLQRYTPFDGWLPEGIFTLEAPNDEGFKIARAIGYWTEKAGPVFHDVLRCLCQNPCRIRRCLINMQDAIDKLISDLSEHYLQGREPEDIEHAEGQYYSSVVTMTIGPVTENLRRRVSAGIITLGFQQELYELEELPDHYLQIATALSTGHDVIDFYVEANRSPAIRNLSRKSVTWRSYDDINLKQQSDTLERRRIMLKAEHELTRALAWMHTVLKRLDAYPQYITDDDTKHRQSRLRPKPLYPTRPSISSETTRKTSEAANPEKKDCTTVFPLTYFLTQIEQAKRSIHSLGLFELSKDYPSFREYWSKARLDSSAQTNFFYHSRIRQLCKTMVLACIHVATLRMGLQKYGHEEGLRGKVRVVPEDDEDIKFWGWIIPKKVEVI